MSKHFIPSHSNDERIWRFSSFVSFVAVLQHQALFCPSLRRLRELDPFEGTCMVWDGKRTHEFEDFEQVCVSCWYLSDFESLAMWRLYGPIDGAIAMQSTIGDLWKSRRKQSGETTVSDSWNSRRKLSYLRREYLELIEYVPDFELRSAMDFYRYRGKEPGTLKRKSFEHEHELRFFTGQQHRAGAYYRVRLETLLNAVYVSPQSAPWFKDVVEQTLADYGLPNVPVLQSRI